MSAHLTLPPPVSANRLWRNVNGRTIVSKEAQAYKTEVAWIARASGAEMLTGDVCVRLDVYRKAKRFDLDNAVKPILDALQGVLFGNDSQIVEIHARRFEDKLNPRVEVYVEAHPC